MITSPDIDTVTALLAEAAETLILPRFRHLRPEDVQNKSTTPGVQDLVTVVDHEVESWLTTEVSRLDPLATVIGEEAVYGQPDLLNLLASDPPVWLLDPIDGTRNFARGDDGFGVMLTRVAAGRTECAWIALPARGQMFVAEAGRGASLNGVRLRVPAVEPGKPLRGVILARYMPEELRARVAGAAGVSFTVVSDSGCGAVDYTDITRGALDFAVYYRLLPWDHVAPALILSEAGGCVQHIDGRTYGARSVDQLTVAARSPEAARFVRSVLDMRP